MATDALTSVLVCPTMSPSQCVATSTERLNGGDVSPLGAGHSLELLRLQGNFFLPSFEPSGDTARLLLTTVHPTYCL